MATRTYEERKRIQAMWENGAGVKEIGEAIKAPVSSIYAELRRGKTGERMPDQRPRYDANLAQTRFREAIERRGNRGPRQPTHTE